VLPHKRGQGGLQLPVCPVVGLTTQQGFPEFPTGEGIGELDGSFRTDPCCVLHDLEGCRVEAAAVQLAHELQQGGRNGHV
jgi:hypothetical protein